eukprot:2873860-Prymnesium_polylepis.1
MCPSRLPQPRPRTPPSTPESSRAPRMPAAAQRRSPPFATTCKPRSTPPDADDKHGRQSAATIGATVAAHSTKLLSVT